MKIIIFFIIFKINIHSISNCDEGNPKITLVAYSEGIPSSQPTIFNMTLIDEEKKEYITNCRKDGSQGFLRILNNNKRILQSSQIYCEFEPPETTTTLTYKEGPVLIIEAANIFQVGSSFDISYLK